MKNKANGFTLVEVILILALIGVMTPIIYSVFFGGQKGFEVSVEQVHEQTDHRILRDYLVKELRYASYIDNEEPGVNEEYERYYGLKIIEDNGVKRLEKTQYEGVQIISSNIMPIKFNDINIETKDETMKVKFTFLEDNSNYKITILLENRPTLNAPMLSKKSDEIFYAYPEDIQIANNIPKEEADDNDLNNESDSSDKKEDNENSNEEKFPGIPIWDSEKTYNQGLEVIYNNRKFKARYYCEKNKTPGNINHNWQELTDEWRNFNIYLAGDIIKYNSKKYKAKWYSKNHIPTSGDPWELIQ